MGAPRPARSLLRSRWWRPSRGRRGRSSLTYGPFVGVPTVIDPGSAQRSRFLPRTTAQGEGQHMQVPAPFEYARAATVEEAIALLERLGPEARLVAGGQSLLPMMKLRLATPEHLVDINPLEAQLRYIREEGGEMRIGA